MNKQRKRYLEMKIFNFTVDFHAKESMYNTERVDGIFFFKRSSDESVLEKRLGFNLYEISFYFNYKFFNKSIFKNETQI